MLTPSQIQRPLVQALESYQGLGRFRFHVPGHAGRPWVESVTGWHIPGLSEETYLYDQTEVEGLDVLSEPEGCLKDSQALVAQRYGTRESFYSVNGASAGLMAALLSTLRPGDRVLLPRNVHRSVVSGLILTGAVPVWMMPDWDATWGVWRGLTAQQVAQSLDANPLVKALVVTSPTYEGIGSDIAGISASCREKGVVLVVDEAHGSLWHFTETLPPSALTQGADVVVQSLHKSAGSLTQTALAHLPVGSSVDAELFQEALNTVQTTSPSYLLMASLESSALSLSLPETQDALNGFVQQVNRFRHQFSETVQGFALFSPDLTDRHLWNTWDPTRLLVRHTEAEGEGWAVALESDFGLTYESTSPFHSLYVAQVGLEWSDYETLLSIFQAYRPQSVPFSNKIGLEQPTAVPLVQRLAAQFPPLPLPEVVMTPREAFFSPLATLASQQHVARSKAVGRVARNTVVHCPPGVPVLLPGERIQPEHLPYLGESIQVLPEGI